MTLRARLRESRLSLRSVVVALLIAVAAGIPISANGASPLSVQVVVGFPCVSGTAPSRAEVLVTLRTSDGHERGRLVTTSDKFGTWGACFELRQPTTSVNGGDRLTVQSRARHKTFTVPHVEPRIDRVRDVIEGWAAPSRPLDLVVTHRDSVRRERDFFYQIRTDASGRYRFDTTRDFDLVGFDEITVVSYDGLNLFGAVALTPGMHIGAANNVVSGSVNNGTHLTIRLFDRPGHAKAESTAGPVLFGQFEVAMFAADGSAAYPLDREWVAASFASDAVIRVPVSELRGSAARDKVWGRCPPSAPYVLVARRRTFAGTAGADGRLERDLSARVNLQRGDKLELYCRYPTGDIWQDADIAL